MAFSTVLVLSLWVTTISCSRYTGWLTAGFQQIAVIDEKYSGNSIMKQYQPTLSISDGCSSYPAVDTDGKISLGIDPTIKGPVSPDCFWTPGQVYARSGMFHDAFGIMYAWHFPVETSSQPGFDKNREHIYGWQHVVIWFDKLVMLPYLMRYTSDAQWLEDKEWAKFNGRPAIKKEFQKLNTDTNTPGNLQPLIAWDSLSLKARTALTWFNWGSLPDQQFLMNDWWFNQTMNDLWLRDARDMFVKPVPLEDVIPWT